MAQINYTGKQEEVLRPDELRLLQQQQSNKRSGNVLKSTASSIGGAVVGAGLTSRILPFLNEIIPADIALKGISKISPKIGNFLKKGMEQGLDLKSGLAFLKGNNKNQNQNQPSQNRNIIEQESPELHEFILNQIRSGRTPLQAAALAALDKSKGMSFTNIIQKLQKTHKLGWGKIIENIYGSGELALPHQATEDQQMQSEQMQQPKQPSPAVQKYMQTINQIGQKIGL